MLDSDRSIKIMLTAQCSRWVSSIITSAPDMNCSYNTNVMNYSKSSMRLMPNQITVSYRYLAVIFYQWLSNYIQSPPVRARCDVVVFRDFGRVTEAHLFLNKMATASQTIFSDAFFYMKRFVRWFKCHWSLFQRIPLPITQHWLKQWLVAE